MIHELNTIQESYCAKKEHSGIIQRKLKYT